MLMHWLYPYRHVFFGFNLFKYITFRAAFAAITAFVLSIVLGRRLIEELKSRQVVERVDKSDSRELARIHSSKEGTPTMGGLLMVSTVLLATLLWGDVYTPMVAGAIVVTGLLGLLGYWDDSVKLSDSPRKGISAKVKFLVQCVIGLGVGLLLYHVFAGTEGGRMLALPFMKHHLELGVGFVFLCTLVLVSSSNAVNLTDGLDGLAAGSATFVALAFAAMGYIVGRRDFSSYLMVPYVPHGGEVAIFCAALAGATLGFLWFNCYPAQVFMGDTGALPLGGAIGYVASCLHQEILLLIVGGIFVTEALSVVFQVVSFRLTGRRIFRIAPLHHHFQFAGLTEPKITIRFWIVGAVLAVFSVCTLKLR